MKPLTVHLPDDVYERAVRRAADRGTTLPCEVADLIKHFSEGNGESAAIPSAPCGLESVLQELAAVAEECRSPNWDGHGAAPVSQETLGFARSLVSALPQNDPWPSVGVEPDGQLTLEWYRNPSWTLSVSVSPEGDLFYAALFEKNDVRGREVFSSEVPPILLGLIRRVGAA
jgi:hypothetical protein